MEPKTYLYPCWTLDLRRPEQPAMESGLWCREGGSPTVPCACRALPLALWGNYFRNILERQRQYGEYFLEQAERMGFLFAPLVRTAYNCLLGAPSKENDLVIQPDKAVVLILYYGKLIVPPEAEGRVEILRDVEGLWEPCRIAVCVMPASSRGKLSSSLIIKLDATADGLVEQIVVTYRGGGKRFDPGLFRLAARDGQPPGFRPFSLQPVVSVQDRKPDESGDVAVA